MKSNRITLLVTGAAGHLGRQVVESLLDSKVPATVVAGSRSPAKLGDLEAKGAETRAIDFEQPAGLAAAFKGVDRLLIVSTDAVDRPGRRLAQHLHAIEAAKQAGVKHVLYTSFTNAMPGSAILLNPDHCATEELLRQAPFGHTILRNNYYMENLLGSLPHAVKSGQLFAAAGDGAAAYVSREDCARAAAAALSADFDGRRTLDITGQQLVTHAELAKIVSDVTGRPVTYVPVDVAAVVAGMVSAGLPEPIAQVYGSFDVAIAKGELAVQSTAVADLTGRPPISLRDFLVAHRAALLG